MLIRRFSRLIGLLKALAGNSMKKGGRVPGLGEERKLWQAGCVRVAGCDEVGRGAWAGPVSVGVVVVPLDRRINGVRDSKMLSEAEREGIYVPILEWCLDWSVGHALPQECDEFGMSEAQRRAAQRALNGLTNAPDYLLLDGRWDFVQTSRVQTVVGGDMQCLSIAAASVVAKVTRDRLMRRLAASYPEYDFASNKGYPSPKHKEALRQLGPTPIHRQSWAFMEKL